MELLNGDIYQSAEPLRKLMNERFPVKVSYKLAKMASELTKPLKVIEDCRVGLIEKYGETDGHGISTIKPGDKDYEKFVKELDELLDIEIEVAIPHKVKLPTMVDGKEVQIEPITLLALDKFIEI